MVNVQWAVSLVMRGIFIVTLMLHLSFKALDTRLDSLNISIFLVCCDSLAAWVAFCNIIALALT